MVAWCKKHKYLFSSQDKKIIIQWRGIDFSIILSTGRFIWIYLKHVYAVKKKALVKTFFPQCKRSVLGIFSFLFRYRKDDIVYFFWEGKIFSTHPITFWYAEILFPCIIRAIEDLSYNNYESLLNSPWEVFFCMCYDCHIKCLVWWGTIHEQPICFKGRKASQCL